MRQQSVGMIIGEIVVGSDDRATFDMHGHGSFNIANKIQFIEHPVLSTEEVVFTVCFPSPAFFIIVGGSRYPVTGFQHFYP